MAELSAVRADPNARRFMISFAFDHQDIAEVKGQKSVVFQYPDKFSIIQGEKDPVAVRDESLQEIQAVNIPVVEVPNCGHAVFREAADVFTKALLEMVTSI